MIYINNSRKAALLAGAALVSLNAGAAIAQADNAADQNIQEDELIVDEIS